MDHAATPSTLSGDPSLVLPEFDDPPPDPLGLLRAWIQHAERSGVREPRAAALATTDGVAVSSRTVLVKDVVGARVVFGSHTAGRKGRDLAHVPHAAVTFYWRETLQQVNLAGPVAHATTSQPAPLSIALP